MARPYQSDCRQEWSLAGSWLRQCLSPEGDKIGQADSVVLPSLWTADPIDLGEAAGWLQYERLFSLPEEDAGGRLLLRLEGVSRLAQVFLNGRPCMQQVGDRQVVEVAVNDLLRSGQNHIALRVGNLLGPSVLPLGTSIEDPEAFLGYRNESWEEGPVVGGVPGDLLIAQTPWFYWERLLFRFESRGKGGRLILSPQHVGPYQRALAELANDRGERLAEANASAGEVLLLELDNIERWTARKPVRYRLKLESYDEGTLQDQLILEIGFPSPEVTHADLSLKEAPAGFFDPAQLAQLESLDAEGVLYDARGSLPLSEALETADRKGYPVLLGLPFLVPSPPTFGESSKEEWQLRLAAWEQAAYSLIQCAGQKACVAAWDFRTNFSAAAESQRRILRYLAKADPFQRSLADEA